jgi:hypothetical protein
MPGEETFWAITSYYTFDDPPGAKRRLSAFREFRRRLPLPLVAVELSPGGAFDLQPGDAELLVQIPEGATLWQKERLLNVALRSLPASCDAVAWMDCDLVLAPEDWPSEARRLLERHVLVQLFRELYFLAEDQMPEPQLRLDPADAHYSAACRWVEGTVPEEFFRTRGATGIRFRCAGGGAWAAHRRTLDKHRFYDALIMGPGDKAVFCAACGRMDDFARSYQLTPAGWEHYARWARSFFGTVRGNIGFVEGRALHLWHGDLSSRYYAERHAGFAEYAFDPGADIAENPYGAWRWNSDKPRLHEFAARYFERRKGTA